MVCAQMETKEKEDAAWAVAEVQAVVQAVATV
jgi:hypothetical protein